MGYEIVLNNNHLAHHGILGQKWGVRRYQNKDGTLTSAGRQKYTKFDSKGYKEEREKELEDRGITGLKKIAQVNNEAALLSMSDKKVRKSLIKQEKLASKIRDAAELKDSKQFSKLLKKWTNAQANIRYDEILQNKDKLEPYAKAFMKWNAGRTQAGLLGGAIGSLLYNSTVGKDYFSTSAEYYTSALEKANEDAEKYKKNFK